MAFQSDSFLSSYLRDTLPSCHHLDVYNKWVDVTAPQTLESFRVVLSDSRVITFDNLQIYPPQHWHVNTNIPFSPQLACCRSMSYSSNWYVDVNIWSLEGHLLEK